MSSTPILDGIRKMAGSVLREAVDVAYKDNFNRDIKHFGGGMNGPRWEMRIKKTVPSFVKRFPNAKVGDLIGYMRMMGMPNGGEGFVVDTKITPEFRSYGLGKKMYGEAARNYSTMYSDAKDSVSPDAQGVWKSFAKKFKKNPSRAGFSTGKSSEGRFFMKALGKASKARKWIGFR